MKIFVRFRQVNNPLDNRKGDCVGFSSDASCRGGFGGLGRPSARSRPAFVCDPVAPIRDKLKQIIRLRAGQKRS